MQMTYIVWYCIIRIMFNYVDIKYICTVSVIYINNIHIINV